MARASSGCFRSARTKATSSSRQVRRSSPRPPAARHCLRARTACRCTPSSSTRSPSGRPSSSARTRALVTTRSQGKALPPRAVPIRGSSCCARCVGRPHLERRADRRTAASRRTDSARARTGRRVGRARSAHGRLAARCRLAAALSQHHLEHLRRAQCARRLLAHTRTSSGSCLRAYERGHEYAKAHPAETAKILADASQLDQVAQLVIKERTRFPDRFRAKPSSTRSAARSGDSAEQLVADVGSVRRRSARSPIRRPRKLHLRMRKSCSPGSCRRCPRRVVRAGRAHWFAPDQLAPPARVFAELGSLWQRGLLQQTSSPAPRASSPASASRSRSRSSRHARRSQSHRRARDRSDAASDSRGALACVGTALAVVARDRRVREDHADRDRRVLSDLRQLVAASTASIASSSKLHGCWACILSASQGAWYCPRRFLHCSSAHASASRKRGSFLSRPNCSHRRAVLASYSPRGSRSRVPTRFSSRSCCSRLPANSASQGCSQSNAAPRHGRTGYDERDSHRRPARGLR